MVRCGGVHKHVGLIHVHIPVCPYTCMSIYLYVHVPVLCFLSGDGCTAWCMDWLLD